MSAAIVAVNGQRQLCHIIFYTRIKSSLGSGQNAGEWSVSANSGYDFDSNSEATPPTTQLADSRSPTRSVPFRSGALSSRVLELRPPEDRGSLAQRRGSLRWLQIKDSLSPRVSGLSGISQASKRFAVNWKNVAQV